MSPYLKDTSGEYLKDEVFCTIAITAYQIRGRNDLGISDEGTNFRCRVGCCVTYIPINIYRSHLTISPYARHSL
jgi:hypothetical protein